MTKFIIGLGQFQRHVYPKFAGKFRELAKGQKPQALMITCADSRIDPSLVLQCEPGDLFCVRNAGNMAPAGVDDESGVAAAVEFAVEGLGIRDIVLCGHSDCGAMKALLHPELAEGKPSLARWLRHAEPARAAACQHDETHDELCRMTHKNIVAQLNNLSEYPVVKRAVSSGTVNLHGWYYDFSAGEIHSFDSEAGRFKPLCQPAGSVNPGAWWQGASTAA